MNGSKKIINNHIHKKNNNFSRADIDIAKSKGIGKFKYKGYLGTPSGALKLYSSKMEIFTIYKKNSYLNCCFHTHHQHKILSPPKKLKEKKIMEKVRKFDDEISGKYFRYTTIAYIDFEKNKKILKISLST